MVLKYERKFDEFRYSERSLTKAGIVNKHEFSTLIARHVNYGTSMNEKHSKSVKQLYSILKKKSSCIIDLILMVFNKFINSLNDKEILCFIIYVINKLFTIEDSTKYNIESKSLVNMHNYIEIMNLISGYNKNIIVKTSNRRFIFLHIATQKSNHQLKNINSIANKDSGNFHPTCIRYNFKVEKFFLRNKEEMRNLLSFYPTDWSGNTPLHFAIENRCEIIVKLLLSNGADVNARDAKRLTPLHLAVLRSNKIIVKMLLSYGADVNVRTAAELTSLHIAVKKGDLEIIKILLNHNANIDCTEPFRFWTPLHFALFYKQLSIIDMLLTNGANFNARDRGGRTTLHIMVLNNAIKELGTTTDLVPQLLGMFDEIARGKPDPHNQQQHAELQKRLSLVQKRKSRISTIYDMAPAPEDDDGQHHHHHHLIIEPPAIFVEDKSRTASPRLTRNNSQASPTPLRYSGRRCRGQQASSRPVSGSSIASSTSSSGCSNGPGNTSSTANPYLASVESLADTCASSQGSGDSGVVTISESSNGSNGKVNGANCKIRLADVDRATAARYFDERRPRYCDPQRSPVERVLLEIVDTEDDYVEHLRQIIQGYLIVWRDDPASLIRDLELNGLFSNIEDIYEFNRNFLSSLETCGLDPIAVANTFIEHNSGFKVYTEYCTNYPRTVSILTDLMGQDEIARAFRERQAALRHALPLGSFLLEPVQRILKYHLLLENLSKEFEAGDESYITCNSTEDKSPTTTKEEGKALIESALQAMTGIAQHINAMKRKHEHAVRVQEIQSLLYGWPGPDLTTSGELIAEGSFRMRGAKAPRHAFLFDRMLLLTKKKEDGLLVYKAHILCSNLTLMESIPGEPLSFHVIPFDNSQLQYKLQARNLEQKREWTLQIKRVILENYNAVIPSHARQLVLQIGQNKYEDDSTPERVYKKSSDYLDRKADRERRRSETGLRHKLKKGRKSDVSISTAENSPMCSRKNQSAESIHFGSRDENLNRSSEIRGSKMKFQDRFTNWRRKSEPGFQSYINLNPSDNEDDNADVPNDSTTPTQDLVGKDSETQTEPEEIPESSKIISDPPSLNTKENNVEQSNKELKTQQSVEEIVGNILMHSQEFQRRLDKQQRNANGSILKPGHQRFVKGASIDSSEEDTDNEEKTDGGNNKQRSRFSRREQCFVRAVNAYNQRSFRSQYDSFRNVDTDNSSTLFQRQHSGPILKSPSRASSNEKRSPENFKKPNIVTESKLIRTALRIREDCDSASDHEEHEEQEEPIYETPSIVKKDNAISNDKGNLGNYDNLQHVWDGCLENNDGNVQDYPTKAAVWLTKLCEGLPDQPQKCGSLPRSFQMMNPADLNHVSKSRFLQRDGKSMTERPFTIASDKPAEINLEDMERYASSCQGSARIAKFPITAGSSTSSSTFFCSLDEASFTDTDSITRSSTLSTSTHVHPDHKIYRANGSANKELNSGTGSMSTGSSLRSVLMKAGSRLQGLRSSQSTETLECSEETERTRYFRSFSKRGSKKNKNSKDTTASTDYEDVIGCGSGSKLRLDQLPYHKQGSPSLGARIAQSDYADPIALFSESRRNLCNSVDSSKDNQGEIENGEEVDEVFETVEEGVEFVDGDSFYERSFETIENYVEGEGEEAFRDSAIFSDVDDSSLKSSEATTNNRKVPPPVPFKRKIRRSAGITSEKPAIAQKPAHLNKLRTKIVKCRGPKISPAKTATLAEKKENLNENGVAKEDDVSAGQSQVGWVKKMVGQLQAQVDA